MSDTYEATGTLVKVDDVQKFSNFEKRTFAVEIPDGRFPQTVAFELHKKLESVTPLDIGRKIKVSFNLRGRPSKRDGKVWNTLAAWKVDWLSGPPEQADLATQQQEEPPPRPDRPKQEGSMLPVDKMDEDVPF